MGINLVDACFKTGIRNIINLDSAYVQNINHSIDESQLLCGKLEQKNEGCNRQNICKILWTDFKLKIKFLTTKLIPLQYLQEIDDFGLDGSYDSGVIAECLG